MPGRGEAEAQGDELRLCITEDEALPLSTQKAAGEALTEPLPLNTAADAEGEGEALALPEVEILPLLES